MMRACKLDFERRGSRAPAAGLAALALPLLLAACNSKADKPPPPVRPVLSIVAAAAGDRIEAYSGSIQPRIQTSLGFRTLGRIVQRDVQVGDAVAPGQVLALLDPSVLDLAVRSSEADLARARSQLSNTASTEARTRALLARQVVSQADFDTAQQAREAAEAGVTQSEANLAKAREQRGYAILRSDIDGVVVATDAEAGQTVAAGKTVVTVARTDLREAVVDLPEDAASRLKMGGAFDVRLQADPTFKAQGKVREVAPQADAATRTRRVKIALDAFDEAFRLGATVSATPAGAAQAAEAGMDVPAAAILERDGGQFVWTVDAAAKTVKAVRVDVIRRDAKTARVAGDIKPGTRIVVAGVHSLAEGQAVKIDEKQAP